MAHYELSHLDLQFAQVSVLVCLAERVNSAASLIFQQFTAVFLSGCESIQAQRIHCLSNRVLDKHSVNSFIISTYKHVLGSHHEILEQYCGEDK